MSEFAFGTYEDEDDGCGCPAVQAGAMIEDNGGDVADAKGPILDYDEIVWAKRDGEESGLIDEEEARNAWFMAVFRVLHRYHVHDEAFALHLAEEGVEIADELGWI